MDPISHVVSPSRKINVAELEPEGESHASAMAGAVATASARTIVLMKPPRRRLRLME
jgi:hypothetical protein